jgi:hypothetical protein
MDSKLVKGGAGRPNNFKLSSPDIWMSEITRRFKASGVLLPARLFCESDREFLERVVRQYPETRDT